jgi:hypothetical protein
MDTLIEKIINYVEKYENPPNTPGCRPIKNFCSILKGEVYKNNWNAKKHWRPQTEDKSMLQEC